MFKSAVNTLMLAAIILLVSWAGLVVLQVYGLGWQAWHARRVMS